MCGAARPEVGNGGGAAGVCGRVTWRRRERYEYQGPPKPAVSLRV